MVARLLDIDDPSVRVAVAQSRHVVAATRNRLYALVEAERADGSIDAEVALKWNFTEPGWLREAPLDERMTFLECPQTIFRRVLASCRDLPEQAWRRLDDDRTSWNGWYAPTAMSSTSDRCSSSTPTSRVTRCARSSTN
jgi:hypothetical protein